MKGMKLGMSERTLDGPIDGNGKMTKIKLQSRCHGVPFNAELCQMSRRSLQNGLLMQIQLRGLQSARELEIS